MAPTDFESIVRRHAEPMAADLGLTIWGIELTGGSRQVVQLFVEALPRENAPDSQPGAESVQQGGVTIDQCADLSRALGLALEVDEVFPGAWTLEVSSPGFERPFFELAQLPPYIGREMEATLAAPLDEWPGRKKFRGTLRDVGEETFTIALDATQRRANEPETASVPWCYVRRAHLIHIFVEPEKPGKGKSAKKSEAKSGAAQPKAGHEGGEAGN